MEEPAEARRGRGAAVIEALREDLEQYAVSDLEERVEALEAEIARCRAQIEEKKSSRAAADAFFKQG